MKKLSLVAAALLLSSPIAFGQDEQAPLDPAKLPFTADSVKMVMEQAQPKIQECYEEMLLGLDKPVQGKILTAFSITPEGLVKNARVDKKGSTLRNQKLNDCVVAVLTALTFPKPPDGRDHPIEFPFNLKAVK